jgi:hypothetical protein
MMMVTHRTLTQSKVNSKHRRTFLSRWNHSCVCSFRWISALICTRFHHQLVIWIRYAGRRPRYSLISTEVTSTASVLLLLIMLCSSAELFAPLARVQHWRRHRRSRAQVYQRIIGARASLQARSRAYERARVKKRASTWLRILSLFLPSKITRSPSWAELGVMCSPRSCMGGALQRWNKQIWDYSHWTCRPVRRHCEAA